MTVLREGWAIEEFDPRWPEFIVDPYPFYHRLQREDPVHYVHSMDSWWVSQYADVVQVLSDSRLGRAPPKGFAEETDLPAKLARIREIPPNMIYTNPPIHTRLRSIVNNAFTPSVVENLKPRIQEIAGELIDQVSERKRIDIIADYAFPLPVMVIAELFGIPMKDSNRIKSWSGQIILSLDQTQPREVHLAAIQARIDFVDYLKEHMAKPERWRKSELLRGLLSSKENGGDALEASELYSMCVLLLVAAHENTTNVIGNGTFTLLQNPEQLNLLRNNSSLFSHAIEELLRYISPVQRTTRFALEDIEMHGNKIRKGDLVTALIGAANRDPEVFSEPDKFDVSRVVNPHIAFGRGIHFCLGAPLARSELIIAFQTLLQRFPNIQLEGKPTWKLGTAVRGLSSLFVSW